MNDFEITKAEFALFRQLIFDIAGISLSDSKQELVAGRLSSRLRILGLDSYHDYYQIVAADANAGERQRLVDLLTTNETYFFREQAHFEFLRNTIIPQRDPATPLNIWSAAASTGEEIYTLAMVLAECLGETAQWNILGSDINKEVLTKAERGEYTLATTRGLPPEYLQKYCLKGVRSQEGKFLIRPQLRRHTRFAQINLNTALPDIGPFDVAFLRNVMIYFNNATRKEVVARIVRKLRPGGYLILGHSESLNGIENSLKLTQPTVYQLPPHNKDRSSCQKLMAYRAPSGSLKQLYPRAN